MQSSLEIPVCVERLQGVFSGVFANLLALSQQVDLLWQRCAGEARRPTSRDLSQLRELIDQQLLQRNSPAYGAGVLVEPGELGDREMYLEWSRLAGAERTLPLMLNFNQRSDSFYNYLNMPWYSGPRETGNTAVEGPYVDLYGSDMYVLTFTLPIRFADRCIGVAGADVPLPNVERALLSSLLRLPCNALLVSAQGRVIATNTADYSAGELVVKLRQSRQWQAHALEDGLQGWQLLCEDRSRLQSAA
jgi:hypothetical protein